MVFEFKNNYVNLDFGNGLTFELEPLKMADKIKTNCDVFQKYADGDTKNLSIEGVCNEVIKAIDDILGAGSTKKIFGERKITFFDLLDVWTYICNEQEKFNKSKKLSMGNRQQRRAKK